MKKGSVSHLFSVILSSTHPVMTFTTDFPRRVKSSPTQPFRCHSHNHAAAASHMSWQSDTNTTQQTARLMYVTMGPVTYMRRIHTQIFSAFATSAQFPSFSLRTTPIRNAKHLSRYDRAPLLHIKVTPPPPPAKTHPKT